MLRALSERKDGSVQMNTSASFSLVANQMLELPEPHPTCLGPVSFRSHVPTLWKILGLVWHFNVAINPTLALILGAFNPYRFHWNGD